MNRGRPVYHDLVCFLHTASTGLSHSPPATRRSPRRMEKKPVYVLNLIIPPQTVDNCLEPAKAAVQLQVYSCTISSTSSNILHGVEL